MIQHYVIIDGVLQKSSPDTRRWAQRVAQVVPRSAEEKPDAIALPRDTRSDFEILESLDESF